MVSGLAVTQHLEAASCNSILVASSNEKSDLMTALAAEYSATHPGPAGCGPIVKVERVASGDAERRLAGGWTGSDRPDVWAPQASTWVLLLHYQRPAIVPDTPLPSIANSPLVVAMPQPMAQLLGWPVQQPGWKDLVDLAENPLGWGALGRSDLGSFRLGKTDPGTSTSGMHALIAAYYAATGKSSNLTSADISSTVAHTFVARLEGTVSHYADTADTFLRNLSSADDTNQALSYVSAVTIEEQELWAYNQGDYSDSRVAPRVKLAAIYPRDGTLVADHPYVTLNASWVDTAKRQIADGFLQWLLASAQESRFAQAGFRDSRDRATGALLSDSRIVPTQPVLTFALPEPAILAAIQSSWSQLRKSVRLLLVLDTSSSAALGSVSSAMQELSADDLVEVWAVSGTTSVAPYRRILSPTAVGTGGAAIQNAIKGASSPSGPSPLYAAARAAYSYLLSAPDATRINAVVLIAGAGDDGTGLSLSDLEGQVRPLPGGLLVRIYTVAFPGSNQTALLAIARASGGYYSQGAAATAVREALVNT
jgi:Ca-activated chloride channel family protein